jgi:hypothetical protein
MPAAFDTYPKLLNGMEAILDREDLKVAMAGWVWLAEIQIQRELKMKATETFLAAQDFTADQQYITPPSDFLEARYIEIQTNPLRSIYPESLDRITNLRQNVDDGIPRAFAVHAGNIELGPIPGAGITYDIYYYSGLTHLSNASTTGWLLDKGADALMYTALINSAPHIGDDERMATWGKLADVGVESLRVLAWNEKVGGGPLVRRPDVFA